MIVFFDLCLATAPVVTTGTVRPAGVYGGVGPYAGGYGMATYGMGFAPGRYVHTHNIQIIFKILSDGFNKIKFVMRLTHLISPI